MKRLEQIDSLAAFAKKYDSGGFLWSFFTASGDGQISAGEIALQAMRVWADAVSFLQLEMDLDRLRPVERVQGVAMLDAKMRRRRSRFLPARTTPSAFAGEVEPDRTVILTGFGTPSPAGEDLALGMTIKFPVQGTALPACILVKGRFTVFRFCDDPADGGSGALVVVEGARTPIPAGKIRLGGLAVACESTRDPAMRQVLLGCFYEQL